MALRAVESFALNDNSAVEVNLTIRAYGHLLDGFRNFCELFSNSWPACCPKHKNGEFSSGEVLLMAKLLICRDEYRERVFGDSEKLAVFHVRPAHFEYSFHIVLRKGVLKRHGSALVEENSHSFRNR
jgi:hypothetical protein